VKLKWDKLLSNKRKLKKEKNTDNRSHFQKDYDKIIFSNAFRRLGRKTQVHPFGGHNDHVHVRLTHSLEVSSVGRSFGYKLTEFLLEQNQFPQKRDINDISTIIQVACLGHDIGNPPFGHAGEFAIRDWFGNNKNYLKKLKTAQQNDFLLFEGNAQGFRIVTNLEYDSQNGLNLTYASLASLVKYPWCSDTKQAKMKQKFNILQSSKDDFYEIFENLGLISKKGFIRHPLSYLMEVADDICYRIVDTEDAVEMGILTFAQGVEILESVIRLSQKEFDYKQINLSNPSQIMSKLRSKAINVLINITFDEFVKKYKNIMHGDFDTTLLDSAKEDSEFRDVFEMIDEIMKNRVFATKDKVQIELGGYEIIKILLDVFVEAVCDLETNKEKISYKNKKLLNLIGSEKPTTKDSYYTKLLKITDYISGMTDDYATNLANRLHGRFDRWM
jgi:dGTPase